MTTEHKYSGIVNAQRAKELIRQQYTTNDKPFTIDGVTYDHLLIRRVNFDKIMEEFNIRITITEAIGDPRMYEETDFDKALEGLNHD